MGLFDKAKGFISGIDVSPKQDEEYIYVDENILIEDERLRNNIWVKTLIQKCNGYIKFTYGNEQLFEEFNVEKNKEIIIGLIVKKNNITKRSTPEILFTDKSLYFYKAKDNIFSQKLTGSILFSNLCRYVVWYENDKIITLCNSNEDITIAESSMLSLNSSENNISVIDYIIRSLQEVTYEECEGAKNDRSNVFRWINSTLEEEIRQKGAKKKTEGLIDSLKKEIAYQKLCALLQLKICIYSNNPYGIPASVYDVSFKNEDEKKSFILKYKEIIKRYSNEKNDMNRIFGNNCIIDVNLYDNQQDKEFPRIAMTDFDRELLQIYATFYSIIKYYVAIRYNPQIELKEIEECAERDYISTAILMEFKKAALYLRNRQMLMVYNAVSNNEILEKPMLELKDGCGYNALHYSIISNNLELTKTLLHRMKVNESIMEENSIIERCKLYGNVMLFAKRRDFLDSIINSSKEFTPLFEMERSLKRMKGMNVALGITKACAEKMLENANEQMLQAGSYSDEGYEDYDEYEDYDNYEEYDDYEEPCSEEDELREIEDLQEKEYSEDMNENYERDYYEIAQSLYEDFKSSKFTSRLSLLDPDAKNDELDAQLDELYDVRIGLRAFLKERYESGYDELKQCEHLYVKILQNVYSDSEKLLSYLKTDYDNLKLIEIEGNEILVKEN